MSLPRLSKALQLIKKNVKARTMLDVGCNNGELTEVIARHVGAEEVYGVDVDEEALKMAMNRGIKVHKVDVSTDKLPFSDNTIDLVTSMEVIEHLVNPDNMLQEIFRVLRRGGYLLLTTPNLASWINRALFLLGYQPYNAEVSTVETFGVFRKLWRPSGHIRPFTLRALKEIRILRI
ncbi:MAG: class I SAM-dependent methyltransferase [Infirmifilum sp.]